MRSIVRTIFLALVVATVLAALPYRAQAIKLDKVVEQIGPYKLGTSYEVMKNLAGFTLDKGRTHPEQGIVAAKIIDKRIANTRTIQRFTFRQGQLARVSIIFHPPQQWTEEAVRGWLLSQWGNPGPKEKVGDQLIYVWKMRTTYAVILPADGGRWMASIQMDPFGTSR